MQAASEDYESSAVAHSSATRSQIWRAIVAAFISLSLLFMVVSFTSRHDEGLSHVVVDPKLQRWPLTTALYVAFVQFLSQVLDPSLQFGEQQSVLLDAGGTEWKVIRTWILPKSFFGGNSEGVTHLPKSKNLIYTGMDIIRRTKATYPFETVVVAEKGIPANFSKQGYRHIGDVSSIMHEGKEVLLTSLEEPTFTKPLMMMFSADKLEYMAACALNQSHSSLLAVDPRALVMYSTEFMDVTHVKRYAFPNCTELAPLPLVRDGRPLTLQGVQGGSVWGGQLYLSTNQIRANNGDIFVIDTATGNVDYAIDLVCGMGVSEMEGIDVWLQDSQLRMLVISNFLDIFCTVTELHNHRPQPRPAHAPVLDFAPYRRR